MGAPVGVGDARPAGARKAMADAQPILSTLEIVAERCGDPTARVYQRLFQLHPELERLSC